METRTVTKKQKKGLTFDYYFSREGASPFDEVTWDKRSSIITEPDGKVVFEMRDVEVPSFWTQLATDIIVSKYFRKAGVPETGNEVSARQVIRRIARTIRSHGEGEGYFVTPHDADIFESELTHLLIHQKAAFNSPVWFNCGLYHEYNIMGHSGNFHFDEETQEVLEVSNAYQYPQCSACFIQSISDDIDGIFDLVKAEVRLFKYGSGTGTNFSHIRSRFEKLSGGGYSSGLITFLEVFDRAAGSMKSGGTTRRAAKMVCLDMDHPEIMDFIDWKVKEEKKARLLIAAGYPSDFNGEAYHTIAGQNANNSVRLSDEFMNAVLTDSNWKTTLRTNGSVHKNYLARDIMKKVCEAAWVCADPGVQFDTIINEWHTCPNTDKIRASNPCSEYMFLDDSACNLASLNIVKFAKESGEFDVESFRQAVKIVFTAQEILISLSSYPTRSIAKNSYEYRPLGIGFANMGTYLMINGIPYDSERAFNIAAAVTAIMTGHSYRMSAEIAAVKGAFKGFTQNRDSMLRVMKKHRDAAFKIDVRYCPKELLDAAREDWDQAVQLGEQFGYRNAQASVLAPTGTIGLLMDCDTTGVEPEFALVKWKKLAGGGYFKIINTSVPRALRKLGYGEREIEDIIHYMRGHGSLTSAPHMAKDKLKTAGFSDADSDAAYKSVETTQCFNEYTAGINTKALILKGWSIKQVQEITTFVEGALTVEGAPHLREEHYAVFDCANTCGNGKRFIAPMGHVKMMAATQPFLSGAISKTVNLPNNATVEDIEKIYVESWKLGLKAVALYRDGCKASQPLNKSDGSEVVEEKLIEIPKEMQRGYRKVLPFRRNGTTWKNSVGGNNIYIHAGEYDDGSLGEIFLDMHKQGAAYRSMANAFAISVSLGLQYGVPLDEYVDAFTFTRFEPNGMTDHPNIRTATSIIDFVFRVLGMEYLGRTDFVHVPPSDSVKKTSNSSEQKITIQNIPVSVQAPKISAKNESKISPEKIASSMDKQLGGMMGDAPLCNMCGHITVRNGACYKCLNCGNSLGCS